MVQVTVGKWGNNLAVRLPNDVVKASDLHDGERVDVSTKDGLILLRRMPSNSTLEQLFEDNIPEAWRAIYAEAYDWGPEIGREIVRD